MVVGVMDRERLSSAVAALKRSIKYFPPCKLLRERNIAPQGIYLEITDGCNMACPMCITREHARRGIHAVLGPAEIRDILLRPCRALGFSAFTISGGEPTLVPHLREVIDDAVGLGYRIFLTSNVLRWDEGLWRDILTRMRDPQHTIMVSFDSATASEMNAIRGGDVFTRVTDHCRRLVRLRGELKAATQLKAATVLQPANASSLAQTARFILDDLGLDKVLVHLRHKYSRVTFRNYRHQARAARYSGREKEAMARAVALTFKMAAEDPRIVPTRGTLRHWLDFCSNPLRIQKVCDSSALVYVDPYGNVRGCLSGAILDNIRGTSVESILRSKGYRRFLRFARICAICVHGCS